MKERIQELIGQAQEEVWGNNPFNGSPEFEGYELDAEKFAQLIVRECIEQVITGPNGPAHYAVEAALRLKKHFGVEE